MNWNFNQGYTVNFTLNVSLFFMLFETNELLIFCKYLHVLSLFNFKKSIPSLIYEYLVKEKNLSFTKLKSLIISALALNLYANSYLLVKYCLRSSSISTLKTLTQFFVILRFFTIFIFIIRVKLLLVDLLIIALVLFCFINFIWNKNWIKYDNR